MSESPEEKPKIPKQDNWITARLGWLSKLRAAIFVVIFAALGTAYLLASHAATPGLDYSAPGKLAIIVHDESGQPLQNVTITLPEQSSTVPAGTIAILTDTSCSPAQITTHPYNNLLSYASATCTMSSNIATFMNGITTFPVQIGTITDSGYSVSSSSFYHNGSTVNVPFNSVITIGITMVKNAPAPAPTPTPTPAPAPTPTPTSTSNSSAKSSSSSAPKSSSISGKSSTTTGSNASSGSSPADTGTTDGSSADSSNNDATDVAAIASGSSPNVPVGKSTTLTSGDNLVRVTFPKGTFSTDAYCSIDQGDTNDVPVKSANTIGPYSIDCTDSNGDPLNGLKQSVTVAITPPSNKSKYTAYVNSTSWVAISSSNNGKTISFKLAKSEQFATASAKSGSSVTVILNIVGVVVLLLLVGGGGILLVRRRQSQDQSTSPDYWQG